MIVSTLQHVSPRNELVTKDLYRAEGSPLGRGVYEGTASGRGVSVV